MEALKRFLGWIMTAAVLSLFGLIWGFVGHIPMWLLVVCAFVLTLCVVAILLEVGGKVKEPRRKPPDTPESEDAARKRAKEVLGVSLISILERIDAAEQIDQHQFSGELYKQEWTTTDNLFRSIESVLAKVLTLSEVAFFRDAPVSPLPDPHDIRSGSLSASRRNWQWHINVLTAKRDELKRIIEKQG